VTVVPREYDKLVRDDIPDIIRENDESPTTRRVEGEEYRDYLAAKLVEEAEEYAESRDLDELADVLDVLEAVRDARGVDAEELDAVREEKTAERGGFSEGIVLERVEE
jgi:predicted house-cleaning noncanonical NTP pyrophosphatase (MazG superfamily)